MKRVFIFLLFLLNTSMLFAQEADADTTASGVVWSSETKTYWLISIIALSLFLAARTFRNKPEA